MTDCRARAFFPGLGKVYCEKKKGHRGPHIKTWKAEWYPKK